MTKGSGDVDDDDPLEDFFFSAIDFLGVDAVGAFYCGKDWEAIVADK